MATSTVESSAQAAAPPPPAPSPPPPPPSDDQFLVAFSDHFLGPIARDGRLDTVEETPLLAAYHLIDIRAIAERNPVRAQQRLNNAIHAARACPHDLPAPLETLGPVAWAMRHRLDRLTRNEYAQLRAWIERAVPGADLPAAPPASGAGASWRARPLDREVLAHFSVWIARAAAHLAARVPAGDDGDGAAAPTGGVPAAGAWRARIINLPAGVWPEIRAHVEASRAGESELVASLKRVTAAIERALDEDRLLFAFQPAFASGERTTPRPTEPSAPVAEASTVSATTIPQPAPLTVAASKPPPAVFAVDSVPDDQNVWFIGDIHGDLLALQTLLHYIDGEDAAAGRRSCVVFLGDLFDDGDMGHLVVLRVMQLLVDRPGQVALVVGNHDEALGYDASGDRFTSTVSPSDFCDWLNVQPGDSPWRRLGRAAVRLFAAAPRAILMPDGLLVAHGGVPHTDLHPALDSLERLNEPDCLQDFVWTRAHESAKRRIPNRVSKGCTFGVEDFDAFCDKASVLFGRPVTAMVRGHDHVEARFRLYERYTKHPLLTINAMSYRQRDLFGPHEREPNVARWTRNGGAPEVHRVPIPADVIGAIFPNPDSAPVPPEAADAPAAPAHGATNQSAFPADVAAGTAATAAGDGAAAGDTPERSTIIPMDLPATLTSTPPPAPAGVAG